MYELISTSQPRPSAKTEAILNGDLHLHYGRSCGRSLWDSSTSTYQIKKVILMYVTIVFLVS